MSLRNRVTPVCGGGLGRAPGKLNSTGDAVELEEESLLSYGIADLQV